MKTPKSPEFLHPEVFNEVWKLWSLNCIEAEEKAGKPLTEAITDDLWVLAVKMTHLRAGIASEYFKAEHGLGVYK